MLLLFAHWVAHACILCMLRFCGDHPSLWDVQRVQWMLAPSCCAWRISCGGHYRYRMCDFPSWLPLKEGNHDSHLLGPVVQVRFVLYLFFLFFSQTHWSFDAALREFCGANSAEQLTLGIFLDQVGRQMGSEQVLS